MEMRDTIYALSSGALPSGVAVIRISGPGVRTGLETLDVRVPNPRQISLQTIRDRNNRILDKGLVIFFEGPRSFTGEDCAEFHLHGGRAVVDAAIAVLKDIAGFRHAEAGEFAKRAFDNNKLDLTEAEGLSDLIAAETEMQRRLATDQSQGLLKELYTGWSNMVLRSRALIEAELDFSDEEDIPGSVSDQVWLDIKALAEKIDKHLERSRLSEVTRDGFSIAIVGKPNVGKSTLLNALAGRDVAIVSDVQGTTRDIIEVRLDLGGYLVLLKDTAGLRQTEDKVEQIGIDRARSEIEHANLVLFLDDGDDKFGIDELSGNGLVNSSIFVQTKNDVTHVKHSDMFDISISAERGDGLEDLLSLISSKLEDLVPSNDGLLPGRKRHVEYLRLALEQLEASLSFDGLDIEIRSEYLRVAQNYLDRITGRTDVEDLLGVIFSEFCVGK